MHHYPFHVGDYIKSTAHLDLIEDCVYRRLIDLYMETEQPIPNETQQVIRRLRLGSSGLILDSILQEFFTLESDNCWHNARCDAEIQAYRRLAEVSRINGKLGGRPKKTQQVIFDNPAGTQQEPSRLQPITNNQEPISKPKSKSCAPATRLPADWVPSQQEVEFCKTTRTDLDYRAVIDSFRDYWVSVPGARGKKQDWPATWRNWVRNQRGNGNGKNGSSRADKLSATIAELTGANRDRSPVIEGTADRVD